MKKLDYEHLASFSGGGCMKWIRRYERAVKSGIEDDEYLHSLLWGFEACIDKKYQ